MGRDVLNNETVPIFNMLYASEREQWFVKYNFHTKIR